MNLYTCPDVKNLKGSWKRGSFFLFHTAKRSDCQHGKDEGWCAKKLKRYYYNSESGKCEKFIYKGCEGNRNNFKTKNACENVCRDGSTSHH
ncbi:PI-stichotoxin-Hcr2f-like [Hydractinia symbiolongicarpus]|uniref:PI-stichotoxin-Hcr2f-like n=1 Tax=Hydractinia symbiolongicarpus TaxID=13093 RepID=UPI002549F199|nr:PI-stichotoxin-Hcr2f-like [Hydractinia symbiolongicarpus]